MVFPDSLCDGEEEESDKLHSHRKRKRSKKNKISDSKAVTSSENVPDSFDRKVKKRKESEELEEEPNVLTTEKSWSKEDILELMSRMESMLPPDDVMKYSSRVSKIDWDQVKFDQYSSKDCCDMWSSIQSKLRCYRTLKELLDDAKSHINTLKINNSKSQVGIKKPLSSYMLFFLHVKDKIIRKNPGINTVEVSRIAGEKFKNLSEAKKEKYTLKAQELRDEYQKNLQQYYEAHPECVPEKTTRSRRKKESSKPKTAFQLYYSHMLEKQADNEELSKLQFLEKCKKKWKKMKARVKVKWVLMAKDFEDEYIQQCKERDPEFDPSKFKSVITKEEKLLLDKSAGKPTKPPSSGYALYSQYLLRDEELKSSHEGGRMLEISKRWKALSEEEKTEYKEKVKQLQEEYRDQYKEYLESLPPDKRLEEEKSAEPKRNLKKTTNEAVPNSSLKTSKKPVNPPQSAFELFKSKMEDTLAEGNISKVWDSLPASSKEMYENKLLEMKEKFNSFH